MNKSNQFGICIQYISSYGSTGGKGFLYVSEFSYIYFSPESSRLHNKELHSLYRSPNIEELLESPCECGIEPTGSISHGVS